MKALLIGAIIFVIGNIFCYVHNRTPHAIHHHKITMYGTNNAQIQSWISKGLVWTDRTGTEFIDSITNKTIHVSGNVIVEEID